MDYVQDINPQYARDIRNIPFLSNEDEYICATQWRENQDQKALERLVNSHLRLVMKVAHGYRGYGLPLSELIAEGNIGIMQATKKYDPEAGVKFSTYSTWWIRASIQEYVLRSWSLVKMGTTAAQRKLFFSLRKLKKQLDAQDESTYLTEEKIHAIATKLNVKPDEVVDMHNRFSGQDASLNAPLGGEQDSESQWIEWVTDDRTSQEEIVLEKDEYTKRHDLFEKALSSLNERQKYILVHRRLKEPPATLEDIAQSLNISRERVRQLEVQAFDSLKKSVKYHLNEQYLSKTK